MAYILGSEFAYYCPENRVRHLRALTKAKDPWVRVAGAVYLAFENEKEGIAKLRELIDLKDGPGVWAALTLARRGDKSAVARLLRVFADPPPEDMSGLLHIDLMSRTAVLLSNVAKTSGLPQLKPPQWDETHAEAQDGEKLYLKALHGYYAEWWETHKNKVILHDPWFEMLAKQKVD